MRVYVLYSHKYDYDNCKDSETEIIGVYDSLERAETERNKRLKEYKEQYFDALKIDNYDVRFDKSDYYIWNGRHSDFANISKLFNIEPLEVNL